MLLPVERRLFVRSTSPPDRRKGIASSTSCPAATARAWSSGEARERVVKRIGATAHYLTGALDEGPIIDQDVERIIHRDASTIWFAAAATSNTACWRAIRCHVEDRVIPDARKTMVFLD